jgi:hypothetical protein
MTQNRQASSAITGALHPRDHTVIRVQPDCRILNLPEETRRKIYRYALTSSSGPLFVRETSIIILLPAYEVEYVDGKLTVRPYTEEEKMVHYYRHPVHGFKLYAGPNDVAEMNQLKYVCRNSTTRQDASLSRPTTSLSSSATKATHPHQCNSRVGFIIARNRTRS